MDTEDIAGILVMVPLLSALSKENLLQLAENAVFRCFSPGQRVAPESETEDGAYITVIASGSVAVIKSVGEKRVLMRMLGQGSVAGVVSVYDKGDAISELTARTASKAVFIRTEKIRDLIRKDPDFAESYIRFLTSRIRFLNIRIKAYTCGSAEARLAFHILQSDENGEGHMRVSVSFTKLADMLDISRASLYRAFDSLTDIGVIERNGSDIIIKNRDELSDVANGLL